MIRRRRNEQGAVAVVAVVSLVMVFSSAAVAVDLGNAFARKADLQSQADFAALAAANELTGSNSKSVGDPAILAVVKYLNHNQPQDDSPVTTDTDPVMPSDLIDDVDNVVDGDSAEANGEVYFPSKWKLRVLTPEAYVDFGMANAIGFNHVNVIADATVAIESPGKPLPFFLPKDCTTQRVVLKDASSNNTAVTYNPPSGTGNSIAKIDSLDPLTTPGTIATDITLFGSNFALTMAADFHQEATSDRVPADPTNTVPVTLTVQTSGPQEEDQATVSLPPGVFNRPGAWLVRVDNGFGYSKTVGRFIVGDPTPPPPGCGQSSTGDFGMLDSPRAGVIPLADATAMNIAEGLDHSLEIFPDPPFALPAIEQDSCNGSGGTPPPGAQNDKVSQPGNTCVGIKNGMNTDTVTAGIVTGGTATVNGVPTLFKGLLDEPTTDNCSPDNDGDEKVRLTVATNDDVLSCFLPTGVSVGDVTQTTVPPLAEGSIDPAIFSSPRFAVVPVIDYPVNPQNGYYPLIAWQPVFITDESNASTKGTSYASSQNGVRIDSNKVVGLTVVPINFDALPESAEYTGPTSPYSGFGTKVIRLVD